MNCESIEQLRSKLLNHVSVDDGIKIRKQLRGFSIRNYNQKYTDTEHLEFIKRNVISTDIHHPQSSNHPYYYGMFSVCTQHIMADSIEELFDSAIDIENFIK